jgi:hypothetical protein
MRFSLSMNTLACSARLKQKPHNDCEETKKKQFIHGLVRVFP